MIDGDAKTRDRVAAFQPYGAGHVIAKFCWFCDQKKHPAGGRVVGRLRLFKCAQCVAKPKANQPEEAAQ